MTSVSQPWINRTPSCRRTFSPSEFQTMTNRKTKSMKLRKVAIVAATFAFVSIAIAAPPMDPEAQTVAEASLAFLSDDCQRLGGYASVGPHATSADGSHGGAIGICSYGPNETLVVTVDVDRLASSIKTVIVIDGVAPRAFQKPDFEAGLAERLRSSGYVPTDVSVKRPQDGVIEISLHGPVVRALIHARKFIRDPSQLQDRSNRLLDS